MIFFKFFILCIMISYPNISFSAAKDVAVIAKIFCKQNLTRLVNVGGKSFSMNDVGGFLSKSEFFEAKQTFSCDNYSILSPISAILRTDLGDTLQKSDINDGFYKLTDFIDVSISIKPRDSFNVRSMPDGIVPYTYYSNNSDFFVPAGIYDDKTVVLPTPYKVVSITYKLRKKILNGSIEIPGDIVLAKVFYSFGNVFGNHDFETMPILTVKTFTTVLNFPNKCTIDAGQNSGQSLDINFGTIDTTSPNLNNVYNKSINVKFECTGSIVDKTVLKMKMTTDHIGEDDSVIGTSMDGVSIKAYSNNVLIKPNSIFSVVSLSGVGSTLLKFSPSLNLVSYPTINGGFSSSAVLNFIFD